MDLFRTEALTARREDFLGAIDLTRARMAWPMALLAGAFTLGLAAFAALAEHTRSEHGEGRLVPHDAYLHAEFWLSSNAVAQLVPGMRVTMRYQSFPFRQFGHHYGRVLSIADTALAPEEVAAMSAARPSGAAFRVLVQLDRQSVVSAGVELPLRSGMQVEAEFMLERRRLYQLAIGVREPVAGR